MSKKKGNAKGASFSLWSSFWEEFLQKVRYVKENVNNSAQPWHKPSDALKGTNIGRPVDVVRC